jgi:hypothetical protein
MKHLTYAAFASLIAFAASLHAADKRTVCIQITGGEQKSPLADLEVRVIRRIMSPYPEVAKGTSDRNGSLQVSLEPGRYQLLLTSKTELKYLPIARGSKWHELGYNLLFDVNDQDEPQTVAFDLAEGCELILRAVDEQTGEGLPGAVFYTCNDLGEIWCEPINGDNLGSQNAAKLSFEHESRQTDKNGYFRRLMKPHPGYAYAVYRAPKGYEQVWDGRDVELDTSIGRTRTEHRFMFRKVQPLAR